MVIILKIASILLLGVQLVSFYIYNKHYFENWVTDSSNLKARWVNKRDRFLLVQFICFLCCSILLITRIDEVNSKWAYILSFLILAMTIIPIIFYNTKFKIFQPIKYKGSKSKIILNEKFIIRKITEIELKALINKNYSDSFSSKFEDFRQVFFEGSTNGVKLICTHKVHRSKNVGYLKIFDLMHELSENGILDLMEEERNKFLKFVVQNFQRGEEKIIKSNLNPAYSTWLKNNR